MGVSRLDDLCLYHWSPRSRRNSITRLGLTPGRLSRDGLWRPPFVCLSDEPLLAWNLSGGYHDEPWTWDLWMVFAADLEHYEIIFDTYVDTGRNYPKEYRVYERIYKRHVHWIAERQVKGHL